MLYEVRWGSRAHAHASIDRNFFFDFRRRKNVGRGCFSFSFFLLFIFFFSLRDPRDFSFFLFFFSLFLFLFAGAVRADTKMRRTSQPSALTKIQNYLLYPSINSLAATETSVLLYHDLFPIHQCSLKFSGASL